jgi:uncharacterized membrane protein
MHHHSRIQFIDVMRGIAVVVMVMGHSIDAVLSVEVRSSEAFRLYNALRGFTAPIFLFVSGLAFSVATEKRWSEYLVPGRHLLNRVVKILFLFLIGYALHFPFFSLNKILHEAATEDLSRFLQVDVLHCIAASMLVLQVGVFIFRTPRRFAFFTAGLAAAIVLATPFLEKIDFGSLFSPVVAPYLNKQTISIFPVFPYAGFMFAGVVAGHVYLVARSKGSEVQFFRVLLVSALATGACGLVFDLLPWSLLPDHDYWTSGPNFFLVRLAVVVFVTVGFAVVGRVPQLVKEQMVTLGRASLLVYVVHLVLVYGSPANDGLLQLVGQTLGYHHALGAGVAVLLLMLLIVYGWNYLRSHHYVPVRIAQGLLASTLLYTFVTRPW